MDIFSRHSIETHTLICLAVFSSLSLLCEQCHAGSGKTEARAQAETLAKKNPPIFTDEWAVIMSPGQTADDLASQLGALQHRSIGSMKNTFILTLPGSAKRRTETRNTLKSMSGIKWFKQQEKRQYAKRIVISDPLLTSQWHLDKSYNSAVTSGVDGNVLNAWNNESVDGTGITIGIVDDGFQHTHQDLAPNYNPNASYDYNSGNSDPAPNNASDIHGTAVAGVAGAADDGAKCGVGAAYNATMAGLQLISAPISDADIASALSYTEAGVTQKSTISVFNNSWGPNDAGYVHDANGTPMGSLTSAAIVDGVTNGRGGKGVIYVWAGGNGLQNNDNVNYDSFANSRYSIAVGAIRTADQAGQQSFYSEPGAALHIVAPSHNTAADGIRTTDLLGSNGYNAGTDTTGDADCTDSFGGTSSAAPLVSGIVALMLQANPNLGWRDVQHILARTTTKNDSTDSDWKQNGAGFNINHKYGFGLVNAQLAVNMAKTWTNIAPATSVTTSLQTVNAAIPDNNSTGITSNITVSDNLSLEHVEVEFSATHSYRGDLRIVLTSPSGTQSVLAETRLQDPFTDYNAWKFMSVRNWGEDSAGTWSLKVTDGAGADVGTFVSWRLTIHGTPSVHMAVRGEGDFNNDGTDDILFRHSNGQVELWLMNNGTVASTTLPGSLGSDWNINGVGDFNNDGTDDILWRHSSGQIDVWLINNGVMSSTNTVSSISTDWSIDGVGDFNNDGTSDILWRHSGGLVYVWLLNNGLISSANAITSANSDWKIKNGGDLNSDGTDDILWRHISGQIYVWLLNNGAFSSSNPIESAGNEWTIKTVGDFNNDGTNDILWRHKNGLAYVWLLNNGVFLSANAINPIGDTWVILGNGDFNKDGTNDILWRDSSGQIIISLMANGQITSSNVIGVAPP